MSWQQPSGGFNPVWNQQQQAGQQPQGQQGGYQGPSYTPGAGYQAGYQGGYGQGYSGYSGYQQGGYQQGGYQQGGYQQGGYQQGGYQQGGYQQGGYQPQGGQGGYGGGYQGGYYQPRVPVAAAAPAPAPAPEPEAPKPSASDVAKLTLGGGKSEPIVMPKSGKAKKLTLGGPEPAKPTVEAAKPAEAPKPAEASPDTASPTSAEPPKDADAAASAPAADQAKAAEKRKKNTKTYVRDPRPHYNVVFCGHVDAGKSTINGDLLIAHGAVDEREMQKLKREAEMNHREGWEKAYVMDLSEEERAKGKTHETGAGYFETKNRRVTVLDAPGHKAFVPSMIGGATQADLAVMVISARRGEFEAGFENGGQTREHTTLLRTCGVKFLICVINKMDDCGWDKERYDEILGKLQPFFKQNGFAEKAKVPNLIFMPVAGLLGLGIAKPVGDACDWYDGPFMLDFINTLVLPETRTEKDPLCIPVLGAFKDDGKVFTYGKVESGSVAVGDEVTVLPYKRTVIVEGIQVENAEIEKAYVGDNVHLRIKGMDEGDFHSGFVLTAPGESTEHPPLRTCEFFQATVMILEVDNIISNGTKAMLHAHAAQEEVSIDKILATVDPKTLKPLKKEPAFAKAGECIIARIELPLPLALEVQTTFDKMGRFMLRDKGRTIAIGRVTKLYESTHESLKTRKD